LNVSLPQEVNGLNAKSSIGIAPEKLDLLPSD